MAENGYHGATIAKIAREAGLASGLVLYHFESKSAILIDAVESLVATFHDRYQKRLAQAGDDPRRRIDAFIDAQLALGEDADEAVVAAWVVIAAQAVQDAHVREVYAQSVESRLRDLEQLVHAARKAEGRSARGSRRVAAAVLSAIEGSFLLACAAPGVLPRGYAAPSIRSMVDGLLAA
jgi:TetR/AcrR family transcriptional repressor of bet genes